MEAGTVGRTDAWDLFGDALEQFHRHGHCDYYWRRSDGTRTAESVAFYFGSRAHWNPQERAAFSLLRGRVLDAGCGAGKHALALQEDDVPVVAIDSSAAAVRVSRARGVQDVREMSLFELRLATPVDSVALFTNNLSLGGTPDGVVGLLQALDRAVASDGRIVLTNLDVSRTASPVDLAYQQANLDRHRPRGQIRMRAEFHGRTGPWIDWLFLSAAELGELAAAAGWRLTEVVECAGPYAAVLRRQ